MTQHTLYILTTQSGGPIFIDHTSDLLFRMTQHRTGRPQSALTRIDRLVYTESYDCPFQARKRVDALKAASREWINALISAQNPTWQSLMAAPIQDACAA